MNKAKYIIVDNGTGLEVPIVFSPLLQHVDVAGPRSVISAGFCSLNEDAKMFDPPLA
jgi:hypothetical protein